MKLRCERDTLVEALTTAGRAVSGRGGQLPVLSGLHLVLSGDELVVTGSDLELTISRTLEVNGEVDGSAVVPSKLLIDVVRSLEPGAIELDLSELNLTIRGDALNFRSEPSRPMNSHNWPVPRAQQSPSKLDPLLRHFAKLSLRQAVMTLGRS